MILIRINLQTVAFAHETVAYSTHNIMDSCTVSIIHEAAMSCISSN